MTPTTPPPITSPAWDSRTKRIVVLICLLVGGILLWQVADVLPILVVAAVLSYLLFPLTNRLERTLGGRRGLAILITFLFVLVLFAVALLVIFPPLISQLQEFINDLPTVLERVQESLQQSLSQPISMFGQQFVPLEQINQFFGTGTDGEFLQNVDLATAIQAFLGSLTGPAFSIVGSAFRALINILFLVTLMFYFVRDGNRFYNAIIEFTADTYRNDVRRLLYELGQIWDNYLRGQLFLGLFIGVLVFIAASVLGLPNPLVLGLIAGLLEFVPNLGPLLALIPAALLALVSPSSTLPFLQGPVFALVVIVVWTVIQNIEAVVIVPRIMGDSLHLHPVMVIFGVLAGASLAGVLGVILAAPVIASGRMIAHYIYGKVTDQNVFPAAPSDSPSPNPITDVRKQIEGLFKRR